MTDKTHRIARGTLMLAALIVAGSVQGHGALSGDEDSCTLAVGPYRMHFAGYQPQASGNQEFCEDIPGTGRTIIVLESIDDPLRDMEIGVSIIAEDAAAAPVFEQPMRSNARGAVTLMHTFPSTGRFVGRVTARSGNQDYVAEFPFSVGLTPATVSPTDPPRSATLATGAWLLAGFALLGIGVAVVLGRRRGQR